MTPPTDPPGDATEIRVILARLEAKLDVNLAQHSAKLDEHGREIVDHETRLRALEHTPTVSPKTLGAVVVSAIAAMGAVAPFLDRLYS